MKLKYIYHIPTQMYYVIIVIITLHISGRKEGTGNKTVNDRNHFYSRIEKDVRAKKGVSMAIDKKYKRYMKRCMMNVF